MRRVWRSGGRRPRRIFIDRGVVSLSRSKHPTPKQHRNDCSKHFAALDLPSSPRSRSVGFRNSSRSLTAGLVKGEDAKAQKRPSKEGETGRRLI